MVALTATALNPLTDHYAQTGAIGSTLVWELLRDLAETNPNDLAIVDGDVRLTFAEYWYRVESLAVSLTSLGVGPGTCVVYQLPNWWEHLVAHLAIVRAGSVAVPVVTMFREHELRHIFAELEPSCVIVAGQASDISPAAVARRSLADAGHDCPLVVVRPLEVDGLDFADLLAAAPDPSVIAPPASPSDVCAVIYTSGSTGSPKGVLHTHQTLLCDAKSRIDDFGITSADVIFMPSSLAHIAGLSYGAHLPLLAALPTIVVDRWSPVDAVELIERHQATIMNGAPLMLRGLTEEYGRSGQKSRLRVFACGGADVSEQLVHDAARVLGSFVTRAYGCSEIPTLTWGGLKDDPARVASTDGRAIGAVELRVVSDDGSILGVDEVGECEAIGPERCVGYVDPDLNSELFTADGWVRTGDLVSIDADGYLTVRGRKKDIIVRAGENISAREIELLLLDHPDVEDTAVVPIPDERLGEKACAFVVLGEGRRLELDDVKQYFAAQGVAKIKWPESLRVVGALPRTGFGKVDKPQLRSMLAKENADR
ncbi:AMP-binding protein [Aeromicrobium wangtongii]|uniref:AMP-binding protein n=1 Tax=Aeromicrobium wangtongii TaxID=2969247 RepID=A0ABY5MAK3_9ACTN|nr:AMP-binding protein [Aeromicrobium wangtongii]MCD9196957.1 AMP-binding protein [Aeromicrobium wangtongii]UUP14462.1 AMP-binding protein [Aeromicrobium wangtongii]